MLQGGELFDHVVARGAYTEAMAADVMRKMCHTLGFLHGQGVVHRDLKPENILCKKDSDTDIKITDFGLSNIMTTTNILQSKCGTPVYMGEFAPPASDAARSLQSGCRTRRAAPHRAATFKRVSRVQLRRCCRTCLTTNLLTCGRLASSCILCETPACSPPAATPRLSFPPPLKRAAEDEKAAGADSLVHCAV